MQDDVNQEATEQVTDEASQVGLGITDLRIFKEVIMLQVHAVHSKQMNLLLLVMHTAV